MTQYFLSGGPLDGEPGQALHFWDIMYVYLNEELLVAGSADEEFYQGVFFEAKQGDALRIVLISAPEPVEFPSPPDESYLDPIWLTTSSITVAKLTNGLPSAVYAYNETIYDATFIMGPDLQDDELERADKKNGPCIPCVAGFVTNSAANAAGVDFSYTSGNAGQAPSSMGFGWSMGVLQARLDFPVSGDLVFYDGSGSFERWVLDAGDYVAAHPDNHILAVQNVDESFTLTFRNQTKMNFNSDGELETIVDRNDNTTTFTRNGSGHVTSIEDEEGRGLYIDYGEPTDGQPVSLRREDPSTGLQTQLVYDGNGRLWKVIEAEGETQEFLYNGDGLLWKKLDPRTRVAVEYTYYGAGDDEGKIETETHYGERLITYTYTADTVTMVDEDLSALTDDDPRTTVFTFGTRRQLVRKEDTLGNVWEWEFHDINPYLMTKAIDPSLNTTTYGYNEDGLIESVTDSQENTTVFTYNQPGDDGYTDAKRFLIKKIQRPTVTVGGDPVDYLPTQFVYDPAGNLIEVIDAMTNSTVFDVGGDGKVNSVTDRRGKEFVMGYSEEAGGLNAGNLASITAPSGPNSAPERKTSYTHDAYDRVTKVEDNDTNAAQFLPDGNDRITRQTDPRGKYVEFAFVDGLLDHIDLPTNQGSDANRRRTSFTYDDPGRVLQVLGKIGTSTTQMRVRHEFDGFSNLRKLARLKDSVEVEVIHEFNFDKLDRTLSALDPLLRETDVEHAPFCTSRTVTTPRGVETTYSYDSLCRLVQVESQRELIVYEYDELGRPVSISQDCHDRYGADTALYDSADYRAVRVTVLEYDPLDRVTKITFPDEETLEYAYNEEGAVTKMTDVHGKITNYTYYNDGRLYQVILERPAVADRVFTYNYDAAGRLSQIDYPSSTNIVVKFSGPSAEPGWDEAGNLLHLRYLLSNSHLHRFAYTYDDSGNRVTMLDTPTTTGNAVLWEYGYDWLNRLISVSRGSTPMVVYTYDERDNRLSLEWPHLSETFNFTYDDANQLVNRKLATTIVETYDHDDDGNMIARAVVGGTTTTYRWSDSNRLLQRRVDGDTQDRFKYDAGGIRESKKGGPKYFSSGSVSVADMRPSNVPVSYFQGHQLLGMEVDGTFYYYLTDGLSNVRLVVNSTGTVVASSVYDEFGIPETDLEYTAGTADLRPHGFVGGLGVRNDWASSGLHLMRHRYYDPKLGQFLNQDPIGFAGGLNLFTYVGNNPVGRVDPMGLEPSLTIYIENGLYDTGNFAGYQDHLQSQFGPLAKVSIQRGTVAESQRGKTSNGYTIQVVSKSGIVKDHGAILQGDNPNGGATIELYPDGIKNWVTNCEDPSRRSIMSRLKRRNVDVMKFSTRNNLGHELGHSLTGLGHGSPNLPDHDGSLMDYDSMSNQPFFDRDLPLSGVLTKPDSGLPNFRKAHSGI